MWNGASDKCAKDELRRCSSDNGASDMEAMAVDPGVDVTESRTILVVPMTSAALAFEMADDHDHVVCGTVIACSSFSCYIISRDCGRNRCGFVCVHCE